MTRPAAKAKSFPVLARFMQLRLTTFSQACRASLRALRSVGLRRSVGPCQRAEGCGLVRHQTSTVPSSWLDGVGVAEVPYGHAESSAVRSIVGLGRLQPSHTP